MSMPAFFPFSLQHWPCWWHGRFTIKIVKTIRVTLNSNLTLWLHITVWLHITFWLHITLLLHITLRFYITLWCHITNLCKSCFYYMRQYIRHGLLLQTNTTNHCLLSCLHLPTNFDYVNSIFACISDLEHNRLQCIQTFPPPMGLRSTSCIQSLNPSTTACNLQTWV